MKLNFFKKIFLIFSIIIGIILIGNNYVYSASSDESVKINCAGLPGCDSSETVIGKSATFEIKNNLEEEKSGKVISNILRKLIEWVGIIAVLAVIYGGLIYIFSIGEEPKINKAKKIIIYAMVGVVLSVVSYTMIDLVNNLDLNNNTN